MTCSRCGDSGLVVVDKAVKDPRAEGGRRLVAEAYSCDCPKGEKVSKRYVSIASRSDLG